MNQIAHKTSQSLRSTPRSPKQRLSPVMICGAILVCAFLLNACKTAPCCPHEQAAPKLPAIRINAGATAPYTDPEGNLWLADQGFEGGKVVDRGAIEIAGTRMPDIYRTEHYGMASFSQPVANGAYTVKLHFAETFARVSQKGQRVFAVKVEDVAIKDLDIFARAGGTKTAWVETVNVTVADGKLDLLFTPGVQNPQINGIEIIPR